MPDIERCLWDILCGVSDAARAQLADLLEGVAVALQAQVDALTAQLAVLDIPFTAAESAFDIGEAALNDALSPLGFLAVFEGPGCAQFGNITQTIRDGIGITALQSQVDNLRDTLATLADEFDRVQRLVNKYTQFIDDIEVIRRALVEETCP